MRRRRAVRGKGLCAVLLHSPGRVPAVLCEPGCPPGTHDRQFSALLACAKAAELIQQGPVVVSSTVAYRAQELVVPFCIVKQGGGDGLGVLEAQAAFLRVEVVSLFCNFPGGGEYDTSVVR